MRECDTSRSQSIKYSERADREGVARSREVRMTGHPLDEVVEAKRRGEAVGLASICSSHPVVLEETFRHAAAHGQLALVEATCNQVNQDGGYTGMRPADFHAQVTALALVSRSRTGSPLARRRPPGAESMARRAGRRRNGEGGGARGCVRKSGLSQAPSRRVDAVRRRRARSGACRDRTALRSSCRRGRCGGGPRVWIGPRADSVRNRH